MKKEHIKYSIWAWVLISICIFISCSSGGSGSDSDYSDCEVVINAQGPGFLKVINKTGDYIMVFLPEYALGAEVRPHVCEIYGLDDGVREVEISRCDGEGCDEEYDVQDFSFSLEEGETYVIEVTEDLFNGISL